jgi:hypothetical protein
VIDFNLHTIRNEAHGQRGEPADDFVQQAFAIWIEMSDDDNCQAGINW